MIRNLLTMEHSFGKSRSVN